jgi:NTP pyrophosphatase (non-canonical NTP hydrolase)
MMNNKEHEVMNILSEECAEVIQAISKCHRFGMDNVKPGKPKTNREHLEEELGDLLAMIDIMLEKNIIEQESLNIAKLNKIEKLKKWSTIFNKETV